MKEWVYRKGFEREGVIDLWRNFHWFVKFLLYMSFMPITRFIYYGKDFVDLINEKGKIRRVYILDNIHVIEDKENGR